MATDRRPLRVVVTSTPGAGHRQALLPLATALRDAGHTILWVTASDGIDGVRGAGFETATAGLTGAERRETFAAEMPRVMALPGRDRRGHLFAGFFGRGAAPAMRGPLGAIVDEFSPDIAIHERAELAAGPVATARGIPHVTVAFSGELPPVAVPMMIDGVADVWAAEGLARPTPSDVAGACYFHPFPATFGNAPDLEQVLPLRPEPPRADAGSLPWLDDLGVSRPCIYITSGTEPMAAQAPWAAYAEAVAGLDLDAVLTLGPHLDPEVLGTVPANLRVERFVPQHLLLDRVSVVVSHAGAGTMLGAAAAGLPQLVVPLWADQWENADAVAGSGAAILLEDDQRSAEHIAGAIAQLLAQASFRSAGASVAAEIAAMPNAADHVATIEALAR